MSLVRINNNLPSFRSLVSDFLDTDNFFSNDMLNSNWVPAANIKDNKTTFEIELAAPGYKKEDIDINIDNGILSISAEEKKEKKEEADNYTRREFTYNSFCRAFNLPDNINQDNINAVYDKGILHLTIPKTRTTEHKSKKVLVG